MSKNRLTEMPLHVLDRVQQTTPTKPAGRRTPPDLDEIGALQDDDILIVHRGNQTYKTTKAAIIAGLSDDGAEIFTFDGDLDSPPVSQTPGTTPVLYDGFRENSPSNGATPDAANNKITVAETGTYELLFQNSYGGTLNATFNFQAMIISDSPPTALRRGTDRKLGTGGDVGSCSFPGRVDLTAGDEVGIYVDGTAGDDIDTHKAQFSIKRIS